MTDSASIHPETIVLDDDNDNPVENASLGKRWKSNREKGELSMSTEEPVIISVRARNPTGSRSSENTKLGFKAPTTGHAISEHRISSSSQIKDRKGTDLLATCTPLAVHRERSYTNIRVEKTKSSSFESVVIYEESQNIPVEGPTLPQTSQDLDRPLQEIATPTKPRTVRKQMLPSRSRRPPENESVSPLYSREKPDREVCVVSDGEEEDNRRQRIPIYVSEDENTSFPKTPDTPLRKAPKLRRRSSSICVPRNGPLADDFMQLDTFQHNRSFLRVSKCVELIDEDFLRITAILRKQCTGEIYLRGHRIRRTKAMHGLLLMKRNEASLILEVDEDDPRPPLVQSVEELPLSEVVECRRIVFTNQPWPRASFNETEPEGKYVSNEAVKKCHLVCRWRFTSTFKNAKDREKNVRCERSLQVLRKEECDRAASVDDSVLREAWCKASSRSDGRSSAEQSRCGIGRLGFETDRQRTSHDETDTRTKSTHFSPGTRATTPIELDDDDLPSVPERQRRLYHHHQQQQQKESLRGTRIALESCKLGVEPSPITHLSLDRSPFRLSRKLDFTPRPSTTVSTPDSQRKRRAMTAELLDDPPETPSKRSREVVDCSQISLLGSQRSSRAGRIPSGPVPPAHSARNKHKTPCSPIDLDVGSDYDHIGRMRRFPIPLSSKLSRGQKYTFGDAFCGAGGASRGAVSAGLRVAWGFDKDQAAIRSFCMNFPMAEIHHTPVDLFITGQGLQVDVLHISPPCQTFSPAHTVIGRDDEVNSASFLCITELIKKVRPRVCSLENTSGLPERHDYWAGAAVHAFTELGCSIRWRIINCAEYGAPQARKRFFAIASCPGEVLPLFPPPTHTSDLSLQERENLAPLVTVSDAISYIPLGTTLHETNEATRRELAPYDASVPLRFCITTCGGGNWHPSGKRDFTKRELACLQSFPLEHEFFGVGAKKQIGNAVPPVVAKTIFEALRKALEKADATDPFST